MGDGDGVQIDHRVQGFGGGRVLGVDPGTKGTEVVAWCGGREGEGERRVGGSEMGRLWEQAWPWQATAVELAACLMWVGVIYLNGVCRWVESRTILFW